MCIRETDAGLDGWAESADALPGSSGQIDRIICWAVALPCALSLIGLFLVEPGFGVPTALVAFPPMLLALFSLRRALTVSLIITPCLPALSRFVPFPGLDATAAYWIGLIAGGFVRLVVKSPTRLRSAASGVEMLVGVYLAGFALALARRGLPSSSVYWPMLAEALARAPLTVTWDPASVALRGVLPVLIGAAVFVLLRVPRQMSGIIVSALAVSAIPVALFGLVQAATGSALDPWFLAHEAHLRRINSTLRDPNSFASYVALVMPALVVLVRRTHGWKRWVLGLCTVLLLAEMVFSMSRAGYVALLVELSLATGVVSRSGFVGNAWGWRRISACLAIALVVYGILAISITHGACRINPITHPYFQRWLATFDWTRGLGGLLRGRLTMWVAAADIFRGHPMLGVGPGFLSEEIGATQARLGRAGIPSLEHAHSYPLQVAAEVGVMGLIAWAGFLGRILRHGVSDSRTSLGDHEPLALVTFEHEAVSRHSTGRPMTMPLTIGLVGHLVTWLTGHPMLLVEQAVLFSAVAAGILAAEAPGVSRSAKAIRLGRAVAVGLLVAVVSKAAVSPRSDPLEVASGVYSQEAELATGLRYRWTTPLARFDLAVRGSGFVVSLRGVRPEVSGRGQRVAVVWNREPIYHGTLKSGVWKEVSIPVGADTGRGILEIRTYDPWIPRLIGIPDGRQLGVQLQPFAWTAR